METATDAVQDNGSKQAVATKTTSLSDKIWGYVQPLVACLSGVQSGVKELITMFNQELEELTRAEADIDGTLKTKFCNIIKECLESSQEYDRKIEVVKTTWRMAKEQDDPSKRQILIQEIDIQAQKCHSKYEDLKKQYETATQLAVSLHSLCKININQCNETRTRGYEALGSIAIKFLSPTTLGGVVLGRVTIIGTGAAGLGVAALGTAGAALADIPAVFQCFRRLSDKQKEFEKLLGQLDKEIKSRQDGRQQTVDNISPGLNDALWEARAASAKRGRSRPSASDSEGARCSKRLKMEPQELSDGEDDDHAGLDM